MKREELLKTKEYWLTQIQVDLFNMVRQYLNDNKMTQTDFAAKLGVSKGRVSQILDGDYDQKLSSLIRLALAAECYPVIEFKKISKTKVAHKNYTPKKIIPI